MNSGHIFSLSSGASLQVGGSGSIRTLNFVRKGKDRLAKPHEHEMGQIQVGIRPDAKGLLFLNPT